MRCPWFNTFILLGKRSNDLYVSLLCDVNRVSSYTSGTVAWRWCQAVIWKQKVGSSFVHEFLCYYILSKIHCSFVQHEGSQNWVAEWWVPLMEAKKKDGASCNGSLNYFKLSSASLSKMFRIYRVVESKERT